MSKKYTVSCEIFSFEYKGEDKVLYAPRNGFLGIVNNDLINLLTQLPNLKTGSLSEKQIEVLESLEKKGIVNGSGEVPIKKHFNEEFKPTRLTLFSTNQCNLRCRYCYASAGEKKSMVIDWFYATSAIKNLINNALSLKEKFISLGFHGGGEPLLPWALIKRIVTFAEEEAQKNSLKLAIYSATNGLLSEKQLEWIIKHFVDLNISFDGLPHVQDYHRPLPDGLGSFRFVDKTFRFLDENKFNYGIRSTISEYNIDLMEESFDFIVQNYKPRTIHFEPVFQCGRCKTKGGFDVNLEKFAEYYRICDEKSKKYGIRFTYSGCRIETLSSTFCGVACDNFSITPDGYLSACYEVTSIDDPKSSLFFYGRINENGELDINEQKRSDLHSISVENLAFCSNCFAKWHCAGECAAKIGHNDLQGERGHERCKLNRKMVSDKLISILESNVAK